KGESSKLSDMNAIAFIRPAAHDFAQKNDLIVSFVDSHMVVDGSRHLLLEFCELPIVRGEESFGRASLSCKQIFGNRPGDRDAIISACPSAYLIENNQGPWRYVVENIGSFGHLNHKGRLAARQVVARPNARENFVDDADLSAFSGDKRAHLGHDD